MRVLVVNEEDINWYPPVRNLIEVLLQNGHYVTVITRDKFGANIPRNERLKYIVAPSGTDGTNIFKSISWYFKVQNIFRKLVREEMEHNDILWTTTDTTVRILGDAVLEYKHVMQLMELIEDIPLLPRQSFLQLNIKRYAQKAYKVVVPEYNRAHIQKVWWNLREIPSVLPNKNVIEDITDLPENIAAVLNRIKSEKRKIILYQGVFLSDRKLENFAEAIERISDEYVMYILGKNTPYREELCKQYRSIIYIPYIQAPFHLLLTKEAYIGLLPYNPAPLRYYSVLNALYCAPNKIFEYASVGLPMLGSDVPGLTIPFQMYDIGCVCPTQSIDEIVHLIKKIDERHDTMQKNCYRYYDSVNLNEIVENILADKRK